MPNSASRGDLPGGRALTLPGLSPVQTPHRSAALLWPMPGPQSNVTGCNKGDQTCGYGGASAVSHSHLPSVLLRKIVLLLHIIKQLERELSGKTKQNSCQMELRFAHTFPETLSKSQAEGHWIEVTCLCRIIVPQHNRISFHIPSRWTFIPVSEKPSYRQQCLHLVIEDFVPLWVAGNSL